VRTLAACLGSYQAGNMGVLLEAVASLAEAAGQQLAQPEVVDALLPPLLAVWEAAADGDRALIAAQECLAALCPALGEGFTPYAAPLLARAVRCVASREEALAASRADPGGEWPPAVEPEFAAAALELISALIDAVPAEQLAPAVAAANLAELLAAAAQHDAAPEVRQPLSFPLLHI
jgi:transportin-1